MNKPPYPRLPCVYQTRMWLDVPVTNKILAAEKYENSVQQEAEKVQKRAGSYNNHHTVRKAVAKQSSKINMKFSEIIKYYHQGIDQTKLDQIALRYYYNDVIE